MTTVRGLASLATVLAVALGAGCGGDDGACDPTSQSGCDDGLICENVQDGEPSCFAPVLLQGRVFDLDDDSGIAGARVVALDVNGAPRSSVVVSGTDGAYELAVPHTRMADGTPVGVEVTLRADAPDYQTFPGGVRQALPISTAGATRSGDGWVLETAQTDIGLIAQPSGGGTGAIRGRVASNGGAGVLVVAETSSGTGSAKGYSAIADRDGDYKIFNLPAAAYTVKAYSKGVNYTSVDVDVTAGSEAVAHLDIDSARPASSVSGSVNIVNPGEGKATSVILVVESTFNEALVRGETPPGLRAPDPGTAPDVSGQFTITGVPEGRYVVLAAFENDLLVRDPDTCIAGTAIVRQEVVSGMDVTISTSFKITGSLDVIGPGANGPEMVTGRPTFRWKDDSSEDLYRIIVLDAFGQTVWSNDNVPRVTGGDVSVPYPMDAPELQPGMYYQFRATSVRKPPMTSGSGCAISQTEDLKGVFYLP